MTLKQRIFDGDARIAIIGVGYVGLPLAVKLAEKGFSVIGADRTKSKIDLLREGKSTIEGISNERVSKAVQSGNLTPLFVADEDPTAPNPRPALDILKQLAGVDVFIICVHTPLHRGGGWKPDIQWIQLAAKLVRFVCEQEERTNQLPFERLIVLESTTYPGTTKSTFAKIFDDFARKYTLRWYLAYSPERTDPGPNAHDENPAPGRHGTFQIPRIVGGLDEPSIDSAVAFYETVFDEVHPVKNLETAEMIKLVENTFRFVSIGFANEMSRIAKAYDLNIWDIIKAAKGKDFGLDLCYPGLIGGHCIPIDPFYLGWAAAERKQTAIFIDAAQRNHEDMKQNALRLIRRLLNRNNKGVYNASILFCGVAYKKDVADIRESAVLDIMKTLYSHGAQVSFWDPVVSPLTEKNSLLLAFLKDERSPLPPSSIEQLKPVEGYSEKYLYFEPEELRGEWVEVRDLVLTPKFDCVVLSTDHNAFLPAYEELILADNSHPIADLRNAIEFWLQGVADLSKKPSEEKAKELRDKLTAPGKYMLLGFH